MSHFDLPERVTGSLRQVERGKEYAPVICSQFEQVEDWPLELIVFWELSIEGFKESVKVNCTFIISFNCSLRLFSFNLTLFRPLHVFDKDTNTIFSLLLIQFPDSESKRC